MNSILSFSRICLAGCLVAGASFVPGQAAESPSFAVVYSFRDSPDGSSPVAGLSYVNGTFYGTTSRGGDSKRDANFTRAGTIFSIVGGTEQVVYSFGEPHHGSEPGSSLIDVGGLLYGTAVFGVDHHEGAHFHHGMVFQFNPAGGEQVTHRFREIAQGDAPVSDLLLNDGRLFGTTAGNGPGYGTVFSMTPSGRKRVLHAFAGGRDGADPTAGLTDIGGTLYGTTSAGGSTKCVGGCGTVFKLVPGGIQVVYRFQGGSDGAAPEAALVGIDGTIYGTTSAGGTGGCSGQSPLAGCGTVFKMTPAGAETVVYSFVGGNDGYVPGSLTAVGHLLYGTTGAGGGSRSCSGGCGTVFKITEQGRETVLHAFQGGDGAYPAYGAKLLSEAGSLYGTTKSGGTSSSGTGTVFRVDP